MSLVISPQPWLVLLDDNGLVVPNGQLAIYEAGTTTRVTVYADAFAVPHPWPITLDSSGRIPGGLYLLAEVNYKFVLHAPKVGTIDLTGAIIKTQDNVSGHGGKVSVSGSVPDSGGLPETGVPGEGWITTDDGHLWIWDEVNGIWVDAGPVQGPPGMTGPVGPQGPQGIQGIQGIQGVPGEDGDTGLQGDVGPQGPQGPQGDPGVKGDQGDPGPPGEGQIGPEGPPGPKGDKGDKGDPGTIGPHAATHAAGGSDPVALDAAQITTGIIDPRLSANVPLKNVNNVFGVGQTIATANPGLTLSNTAAPVDQRISQLYANSGFTILRAVNDALAVEQGALSMDRTGNVVLTGQLQATGLGTTPVPAANLTGTVADARLSANVALRNVNNTFVAQTLAEASSVIGASGILNLIATSGAVNSKVWRTINYGDGLFRLEALNDAQNVVVAAFTYNAATGVFTATGLTATGAVAGASVTASVSVQTPLVKFPTAFPGQNPSADPTTLDDYREEAWFPRIEGGTSHSGQVYGNQAGRAVKIGGMAFVSGGFGLTNKGTIGGSLRLGGLPWEFNDVIYVSAPLPHFFGLTVAPSQIYVLSNPGTKTADFYYVPGAGGTGVALDQSLITNTFGCYFSFAYPVKGI